MVQDMSSAKFPAIPRTPTVMLNGWNTMVNKSGREGANAVIADAFEVKLQDSETEVTTDEGSQLADEPE